MKMRTMILMLCLTAPALADDEDYKLGPDSMRQDGVPQGTVTKDIWHSKVFPETVRDYWVYVPKQYDGNKPACVMVFQDGIVYVSETGDFRVPVVFDNLIHKREMPVTIGIFINPGHNGEPLPQKPFAGSNRSFEYNTLSDQYARFLLEEILPEVGKGTNSPKTPSAAPSAGFHRAASALHRGLAAARRLPQGPESRGQLHEHPGRPRLPSSFARSRTSRSGSSSRTAIRTWTTSGATGGWRTWRWRRP